MVPDSADRSTRPIGRILIERWDEMACTPSLPKLLLPSQWYLAKFFSIPWFKTFSDPGRMLNDMRRLVLVLASMAELVRGQTYVLPNPIHRYVLVPPIERPAPSTTSSDSSILSTPNPNAPIYASDFSSAGYFQPETNPNYIRNATCTWVVLQFCYFLTNSILGVRVRMHADCSLCRGIRRL